MSGSTDRLPYCDIDAILNVWFEKCDQIESGQVKTVSLVERAKAYLDNNQEKERDQKRKLEDLTRRLDPRSDNGYVDRETFLRVAKEWVEMVVRAGASPFVSPKKNGRRSLNESLPNLSDISLDISYGSIEAINDVSLSSSKHPNPELVDENAALHRQIKQLVEEKAHLVKVCATAEDSNAVLQNHASQMEDKLKKMAYARDVAVQQIRELETLKTTAHDSEERCNDLKETLQSTNNRFHDLLKQNEQLQKEADKTNTTILDLKEEIKQLKVDHKDEMENLRRENEMALARLDDSAALNVRLDREIEELKSDLSQARDSQFFQKTPPMFSNTAESDVLGMSFEDDAFNVEVKRQWNGGNAGPTSISTPCTKSKNRGSIGEEFKQIGVKGSPLCEKSLLLNNEQQKEKTDAETQTSFRFFMVIHELRAFFKNIGLRQTLSAIFGLLFAILTFFTFFGAFELGNRKLMPIFWSPTFGLPEPWSILKISHVPPKLW